MMYVVVFTILSTRFMDVFSFNLDISNAIVYEDFLSDGSGRRSYFGYSTVLDSGSPPGILIGAPRANFSRYFNVTEPGVTVHCAIAGNCSTIVLDNIGNEQAENVGENVPWDHKDKAWIGASMDIEQGQNPGKSVVCGHRWKDQRYLIDKKKLFMPGVCYWMESPYETAYKLTPFVDEYLDNRTKALIFGMAQAGSSVHLPQKINKQNGSKLLIGAPGAYNWAGTNVICEDASVFNFGKQKRAAQPNSFTDCKHIKKNTLLKGDRTFPYIGYSVSSGKFFDAQQLQFVTGAPRSYLKGAVIIFTYDSSTQPIINDILRGETIGEYFGASITVTDINGDGQDELIVGAPFFSVNKDEGRIYVFTSKNMKRMELYQKIEGYQPGSQFGLAITSLGLLNRDQYGDIAVGAPYENNGHGAVYIYNGGEGYEGLKLSQKIYAADVYSHLKGFGIRLSNAADIDSNGIKDVAVGSYLSGHTVILRAAPVIILRAEIYASTFLIQRTTSNFSVHPGIHCTGCNTAHNFSVNLKVEVDSKYEQAFVDQDLIKHEFNEKLQFEGHLSKSTYVNIFIKPDPDTQRDIELKLSIEVEKKSGNIILIKKDKRIGEDNFCKNCAVVDKSRSQLENTKTVTFVNACGSDETCDASLQMKCSIKNPRYGNNVYVVGSDGLISLEVMLHNNNEPAYSVTLNVTTQRLIEPAKIPKMCKQTIDLEIVCEIGNLYNDTKVKNITVEFDVLSVTKYAFLNESASVVKFTVGVNTSSNNINNKTQCSTELLLKNDAKIKVSGSSKPDYLLLKEDSIQRVRHLYKVVKEGPTPVKQVNFDVDVPTHYITDNEKSIKFLKIQEVKFYQNGREVLCRYQDQKKEIMNAPEMMPIQDQTIASENKTLFLNCSSSNVTCVKVTCSASEMWSQNSSFDVPIDLIFNASTLRSLLDIKSTVQFSTTASAYIVSPKYMPMSNRRLVSTVMVADKPYESVALWIIILAIIGGILLLCLLVYGMKKAGFFRRKKKELLIQATLQTEADVQTRTD